MDRDEYGWDELGQDLAFLTPLTLMQTHHLLWPLQHRSDTPDAPAVHPYDLCEPLKDLLTADGDYRIIGRALQRLVAPAPEDAPADLESTVPFGTTLGLDFEKGQQHGES